MTEKNDLEKAADLAKSHVKEHQRRNASGSISTVKEYDDRRQKKKLPDHWREAHDHAEEASDHAWNGEGDKFWNHFDAANALTHSATLHRKAAKAAKDQGEDASAKHHQKKAAGHLKMAKEHLAEAEKLKNTPTMPREQAIKEFRKGYMQAKRDHDNRPDSDTRSVHYAAGRDAGMKEDAKPDGANAAWTAHREKHPYQDTQGVTRPMMDSVQGEGEFSDGYHASLHERDHANPHYNAGYGLGQEHAKVGKHKELGGWGDAWDKHAEKHFGAKKSELDNATDLAKAHVKQYTRQDGTIVREHDDSRQAAQAASEKANTHQEQTDWRNPDVKTGARLHHEAAMKHVAAMRDAFDNGQGEAAREHYHKAGIHMGAANSHLTFTRGNEDHRADVTSRVADAVSKEANKAKIEHDSNSLDRHSSMHLTAQSAHQHAEAAHMAAANANWNDEAAREKHLAAAKYHRDQASKHGKAVQESSGIAVKATQDARRASERADRTNSPEDHKAAAEANKQAAELTYDSDGKKEHLAAAKEHAEKAKIGAAATKGAAEKDKSAKVDRYRTAKRTADDASDKADTSKKPEDHKAAANAHRKAVDAVVADNQKKYHEEMADYHDKAASNKPEKSGSVSTSALSAQAKAASNKAKKSGSAEDHQAAADAHKKAYDALKKDFIAGGGEDDSLFDKAAEHLEAYKGHSKAAKG